MESRRRGRGLLVALVAAALLAVAGVVLAAPLRFATGGPEPIRARDPVLPTSAPQPLTPPKGIPRGWIDGAQIVGVIGAVILGILILSALGALIVWLARRAPGRRDRVDPIDDPVEPGAGSVVDGAVSARVVHRGLVRALEILDEPGSADDAVVQAWLGLEDAAVEAGAPRRPAETPSEYAARIIRRFDADRAAADDLRRLYERVRFGGRTAGADEVARARRCLERLLDSWAPAAVER